MRKEILALSAVALLGAAHAEAGVVVTKSGKVIVGQIAAEDVTREGVLVRWPYKDDASKGTLHLAMAEIRWFDTQADAPTAAYWAKHAGAAIDERFERGRVLLEKAAFVEEHERDLERASKLYERAANAARAERDDTTADEARAARARVDARLGVKSADTTAIKAPDPVAVQVFELVRLFSMNLGSDPAKTEASYDQAVKKLALAGPAAVPVLERALRGDIVSPPPGSGGSGFILAPTWPAKALAASSAPEATTALGTALAGNNPFVRVAVASALTLERHRALLDRAIVDPIPDVRKAAAERLATSNDRTLLPAMTETARAGSWSAVEWLLRVEPVHAFSFATDPTVGVETRSSMLLQLGRRSADALVRGLGSLEPVVAGVEQAAKDERTRSDALELLCHVVERADPKLVAPVRERAEGLAVAANGRDAAMGRRLLQTVGRVRGLLVVMELATRTRSQEVWDLVATLAGRLDHTAVPELLRYMEKLQARDDAPEVMIKAASELSDTIPEVTALAGLEGLTGRTRARWLRFILAEQLVAKPSRALIAEALAGDELLRIAALKAIAKKADVDELPLVLAALGTEENIVVDAAKTTVGAFAAKDAKATAAALEAFMAERLESDSTTGINVMDKLPPDLRLGVFKSLFPRAKARRMRESLIYVLEDTPGKEASQELLARFAELDTNLKRSAVDRFTRDLYEPAIPSIGEALRSEDAELREAARKAIKAFKEHRDALAEFEAWTAADKETRGAVAGLLELLKSDKREVVIGAVRSLAAIKARTALPQLVKLLERDDPELKKAVDEAIQKLGG